MPETREEAVRREFEKWAADRGWDDAPDWRSGDEYAEFELDIAWQSWQASREAALREAAAAMCEWCADGLPFSEPIIGRWNELWHIPFPDTPTDTQRVRCSAEKVLALIPVAGKEEKDR